MADGIVLLDADGQHRIEDALRLLKEAHKQKNALVLGVRQFDGEIPFRSLFGNTVTKYVFRIFSGKWVSDTQTGLRAFSKDMVPLLMEINGERYEYEMNMLLICAKNNILLTEVPIATIYHDENNSCSHFRTIRDSLRIYGNLLAFSGTSFISFLLDYILFFILVQTLGLGLAAQTAVIVGNIAARIISAAFNYYLNSTFIFRCKENRAKSILSYGLLACFILFLNTVILYCLYDYLGLNKAIAKLITELTLFIISFTVQKFIIFNKSCKKEKHNLTDRPNSKEARVYETR
jgi:putative flippase GtrA